MGTLISALTGSDDPKEVSVMAKQAVDVRHFLSTHQCYLLKDSLNDLIFTFQVVNLISTVLEALRTSIF